MWIHTSRAESSSFQVMSAVLAHRHYLHRNRTKAVTEESILGGLFLPSVGSRAAVTERITQVGLSDTPKSDNPMLPRVEVY